MTSHRDEFAANISIGFRKAFEILKAHREDLKSARCNQAIMLITEGVDYDYNPELLYIMNGREEKRVRIFTYELGRVEQDSQILEQIACENRGYFVNITLSSEIREKVLNYLNVMSRPINSLIKSGKREKQEAIWSYLQIDLADRRYSNWLWKKFEGNRQREIFLDHAKRELIRLRKAMTAEGHVLLQEKHEYEVYKGHHDFDYLTTVSMPVYGRRDEDQDLIGVAAVDVPIKLLNSYVPHFKVFIN